MKNKNQHIQINGIGFSYLGSRNVLIIDRPNKGLQTIFGLSQEQANKKVGEILKAERLTA